MYDIADALLGHVFEQEVGGLAVRVDESHAFAVLDVLDGHVLEHGGLAHAGLADDVDVRGAVFGFDAEFDPFVAGIGLGEICDAIVVHRIKEFRSIIAPSEDLWKLAYMKSERRRYMSEANIA